MKRFNRIIVAILIIAITLPLVGEEVLAGKPVVERIDGKDRVETSIRLSQRAYKDGGAAVVILAGYHGQADALAGTPLAASKDAPLLLTKKDKLEKNLEAELKRLATKTVYILGGYGVVEEEVEDSLKKLKLKTIRIGGKTRVETAVKIAEELYKGAKVEEAFIVEYGALADALAIGPVAAEKKAPIYISFKDKVPVETKQALKAKGIKRLTIVGGENTVTPKGKKSLEAIVGKTVLRVSGANREKTSLEIANKYYKDSKSVLIANDYTLVDASVGGYFANMNKSPILLSKQNTLNTDLLKYIKKSGLDIFVLGGESAISDNLFNRIAETYDVKLVEQAIDTLPKLKDISLEDEEVINSVLIIYESLSPQSQRFVENGERLISSYEKIETLKLVGQISQAISNIPELGLISIADKENIEKARGLVDILLEIDQDFKVKDLDRLIKAEEKIDSLK